MLKAVFDLKSWRRALLGAFVWVSTLVAAGGVVALMTKVPFKDGIGVAITAYTVWTILRIGLMLEQDISKMDDEPSRNQFAEIRELSNRIKDLEEKVSAPYDR